MSGPEILAIVVVVALTVAAAVLAAAETSLTHLGRARAETLRDEGVKGAATLVGLLDQRDRVLNPILLLVLGCHLGVATISAVLIERWFGAEWLLLGLAVELAVLFVLAEALPKAYALGSADTVATRMAPVVAALMVFAPLRWITNALLWLTNRLMGTARRASGPAVTEEELIAFTGVAVESAAIEAGEQQLIQSVLAFGDTIVREVMVPRPDMVVAQVTDTVTDTMRLMLDRGLTRLPVSDEGIDDIVGMVHARDLTRAERRGDGELALGRFCRTVVHVPETKRAAELLPEMQGSALHMAVVVDEYGGTAGLVTLEDLIEELVGEIVDEFDREEPLVYGSLASGTIRVHGRMPVDEVNEMFDAQLPDEDWDTIGGLIFNTLGHLPEVDESVTVAGLRLVVARVEGRRITQVRVVRERPAATPAVADDEDRATSGAPDSVTSEVRR